MKLEPRNIKSKEKNSHSDTDDTKTDISNLSSHVCNEERNKIVQIPKTKLEKQAIKNLVRTLNKTRKLEDQEMLDRSLKKKEIETYTQLTTTAKFLTDAWKDSGIPLECGVTSKNQNFWERN